MSYRPYLPPTPLLIGYDPVSDLPNDHLARLVEQVVEASVTPPPRRRGPGQPAFDPRLPIKVLVYGYATGQRSSRQLERLCYESLPYLFLTRGDAPSYRTLCSVRTEQSEQVEQVWLNLFAVAGAVGLKRLGHLVVDSTKLRANASSEAVVGADEYDAVRAELAQILAEAAAADAQEALDGRAGTTRLEQEVAPDQMREILRRVRKRRAAEKRAEKRAQEQAAADTGEESGEPSDANESTQSAAASEANPLPEIRPPLGPRMLERVEEAIEAIDEAEAEGRKHVCLTDPDARMMPEGREKRVRECHTWEVAVDREDGVLVVGQTTQEAHDNHRLEPLVEAAQAHEPEGVKGVDGDSGYYAGDGVGRLLEAGVDVCVPDTNTACDLHRNQPVGTTRAKSQGAIEFVYDPVANVYRCPEGNVLRPLQQRVHCGQEVMVYRAERDCVGCPRAAACLRQAKAKRRTLKVGRYHAVLEAARQRFNEPAQRERYRHRGEAVEGVFGFVRGVLGYTRWWLRGKEKVACEGRLIKTGYQLRKIHRAWAAQRAG